MNKNVAAPRIWQRYLQLPRNVLALSFVSLLNDTSSEIIYPLLPIFLSLTLGASPFIVGIIEGAAESVSSLLKLFSGYLSDRFAKRKFAVLAGYALSALMRPFIGFAGSWTHVLVLRLSERVGKGVRSAPRDAILADSVLPEKRGQAFGFNRAMDHFGAVLGPLAAFFLLQIFAADHQNPTADEYSAVFLLASIPAILALGVVLFFVKESEATHHESNAAKAAGLDLKVKFSGNFKRFLVVLAVFTLANSSDAFLLLRAQEVGISTFQIPLVWTLLNVVKVFSSLVGGDLSDRVGRKKMIFAGWILYAVVYAGLAFAGSPLEIIVLFLLYGAYFGLTEGAEKALVADLVPANRRGTAFGWYHLAYGIAVFPASLLTGALWKVYGAPVAFLTCAGFALLAAFALLTVKTRANFDADLKSDTV